MTLTYANPTNPTHPTNQRAADSAATTQRQDAQTEPRLRRLGRQTFMFGSVAHVVVGLLHTYVQLTDMAAPTIRGELEAIGGVANVDASAWELWQGLGLLMGFFMIALGLSNLAGMKGRIDDYPAAGVCAVNIVMFIAIFTIGLVYLGPMQLLGGPLGITMFGIPLVASLRK